MKRFKHFFHISGCLFVKETGQVISFSSRKELNKIYSELDPSYTFFEVPSLSLVTDNFVLLGLDFIFISIAFLGLLYGFF